MARRLRPIVINLGLVAASMGFAAILAELAIRLVAPQQLILIRPDLWQPADTVGWVHRPNVDAEINTGERTVSVFTDASGFRVSSAGPVPESEHEVLLLGDSFMEALQVEYEQSIAGLLQASLPEATGGSVAVRDAGIGGWDPDQYALYARSELASRDYDLVVTALYLGNDVIAQARDYLPPRAPVERYRFRLPRGLSFDELTDAFLRPVNDFLEVRSHGYVFAKNRLQTIRMMLGLAPLTFPPQYLRSESDSDRWDVTADLSQRIGEVAALHGADALFVLVPAPFQVDSLDLMRYVQGFGLDLSTVDLDQPNRRIGEELTARGLSVYDPLPAFRAAHAAGERLYGSVDPHFTPAAHELLAELVAPLVTELLVSPTEAESRGAQAGGS